MSKTHDNQNDRFATTDDSELFFKNVRQLYYEVQEFPDVGRNAYRLKKRYQKIDGPSIHPVIIWDWMEDQAYIVIETNGFAWAPQDVVNIRWRDAKSIDSGNWQFQGQDLEENLDFAVKVFEGIRENYELEWLLNGERSGYFWTETQKEAFRKTMADYFRLTNSFE